ncbi:MAG: type II toxin-antitoxin system Phd/YefM family antitoxin [Deltaproteobacteria bacterium]|nr:type II toxin-antitoxin system Phd/YefM family antitoxin [Deltaproteobacteria bacterium]
MYQIKGQIWDMKLTEDIRPITQLKTRAAELVRSVSRSRRTVVITQHGEARAVLLDVATYEALRDAALMHKLIGQSEAAIQQGRTVPQKTAFERVRRRKHKP